MRLENELEKRLWAAANLTLSISGDGTMDREASSVADKIKNIGFTGPLYYYAGGVNNIHAGLVGTSPDGVIMAFRGTDGNYILDMLNDAFAVQVSYAYGEGKVHAGMMNAIGSIGDKLAVKAKELLKPGQQLYLVGHSKGGGMATLMAHKIEQLKILTVPLKVVTFGALRVGDKVFKDNYEFEHYRYESFLDIVPHLYFSPQEEKLLPRLGPVHEKLKPLLALPTYYSVGTRIVFGSDTKLSCKYPLEGENDSGEALNSFCAIESLLRNLKLNNIYGVLDKIHNKDYPKFIGV